jgi:hypothetical protein
MSTETRLREGLRMLAGEVLLATISNTSSIKPETALDSGPCAALLWWSRCLP